MSEVGKLFQMLIEGLKRIFIVIDAVDEIESEARDSLLDRVKEIVGNMPQVKLMVTSRPEVYIVAHFDSACDIPTARRDILADKGDVEVFIQGRMKRLPALANLLRKKPELMKKILETIVEKTRGM